MFELWKLKRKQSKLLKKTVAPIKFNRPIDEAQARLFTEDVADLLDTDNRIQELHDQHLRREAFHLDIELPTDEAAWKSDPDLEIFRQLTPAGRASLRRTIDEEKTRRREVKAWWWKNVVIPAITALTGLAGVITGMIAVAKK
jgi:hypothetical protein